MEAKVKVQQDRLRQRQGIHLNGRKTEYGNKTNLDSLLLLRLSSVALSNVWIFSGSGFQNNANWWMIVWRTPQFHKRLADIQSQNIFTFRIELLQLFFSSCKSCMMLGMMVDFCIQFFGVYLLEATECLTSTNVPGLGLWKSTRWGPSECWEKWSVIRMSCWYVFFWKKNTSCIHYAAYTSYRYYIYCSIHIMIYDDIDIWPCIINLSDIYFDDVSATHCRCFFCEGPPIRTLKPQERFQRFLVEFLLLFGGRTLTK